MTAPASPSPYRCNNYPCAMPSGHKGPCSSSPCGDSLAAVVAELREFPASWYEIHDILQLAARIERLDAEHNEEIKRSAAEYVNDTERLQLEVEEFRAKLAACERDAARWNYARDELLVGKYGLGFCEEPGEFENWTEEMIDKAIASRAAGEGEKA